MVDRLYISLWVSRGVKSNWKDQDLLISFLDLYYRVGAWAHPILITMPTSTWTSLPANHQEATGGSCGNLPFARLPLGGNQDCRQINWKSEAM